METERDGETHHACSSTFIDYGHSALWPPWKFQEGRTGADLLQTGADSALRTEVKAEFRSEPRSAGAGAIARDRR